MNDFTAPIEIAKDVYWVGYVIPNDPFQCHVYLIKNGNESILIDPGSKITWPETRKKIMQLMPLENIKYLICQHQDPDITACIEDIFEEIGTKDRYIVTHWRTQALLKHYNWGVPFYEIEEHQWMLKTTSRSFKFVFTPYMHFPGAFCTYDTQNKILFSSDIFGAFTESFQLYAHNAKSYFEQMKPFHTHYMPTKEIVNHGLDNMSQYDIDLIAPQHGSIIKKELIADIFSQLRELDVGLFLEFNGMKDVKLLTKVSEISSKIFTSVAYSTNGFVVIEKILSMLQEVFKIQRVIASGFVNNSIVFIDSHERHPKRIDLTIDKVWDEYKDIVIDKRVRTQNVSSLFEEDLKKEYFSYMFGSYNNNGELVGMICFLFDENENLDFNQLDILKNFQAPFNIILTKTLEFHILEEEKERFFNDSITDSLTGLHNRFFISESGKKEFVNSDRYKYPLTVAILDIDKFKIVNDTYGHDVGDIVLKDFSRHIKAVIRDGDMAYRYGGEEFILLMPHSTSEDMFKMLSRLRERIITSSGANLGSFSVAYRFSAGVQEKTNHRSLDQMIKGADEKLYISKETGRDKITV